MRWLLTLWWFDMKHDRASYADQSGDMPEHNDCAVRAFAIASCLDYKTAHALFAKHGRKPRRGTFLYVTANVVREQFPYSIFARLDSPPMLKDFVHSHPQGHYMVWVSGHFLAVCDGVILDWFIKPQRRVKGFWRLV
jgi:hypothetical protein